jgi:sigma-E factor negative regulatory protein RseA
MNEQIDEQLSALMDGELERDQTRFLLRRMDTATVLPARWERYHLVRQTLRRQDIVMLRPGFADAVMAQIEQEPALHSRAAAPWLRWGAGGAIAASVAVAALMLTRPAGQSPLETPLAARAPSVTTSSPALSGPAVATAPVAATTSLDVRPPLLLPNTPVDTSPASFGAEAGQVVVLDPRLQSYLVRHYQAVGGSGQSGFVPYVLLANPQRQADNAQPGTAGQQNR